MAKRLREYVKYTIKELEKYTQTEGSCVRKENTNLHLSMGPFCLADFKHILMAHIVRSKVGFYDVQLDGIVLDVRKIKVLGTTGAMRADDPRIHVNINADVYIFKPEEGAELTGVVKHIGPHQVGVILYRVFNANLRVAQKVDKSEVQMDQEVKFRIRKYNLQNVFPYIEGELLTQSNELKLAKGRKTVFKQEDNVDSGIEERDGGHELDDLLSIIKTEAPSEFGDAVEESEKKKSSKKKTKNVSEHALTDSSLNSANKKSNKKRKRSTSPSSINTDDTALTNINLLSNVKQEFISNDVSLPSTPKKLKKDKSASAVKKRKSKAGMLDLDIQVKEEIEDDDFITSCDDTFIQFRQTILGIAPGFRRWKSTDVKSPPKDLVVEQNSMNSLVHDITGVMKFGNRRRHNASAMSHWNNRSKLSEESLIELTTRNKKRH